MARKKNEEFEFTSEMPAAEVAGIQPGEARSNPEKQLQNATINPETHRMEYDPFAVTKNTKIFEDRLPQIREKYSSGDLSRDQVMQMLDSIYTVHHSSGRNILDDRRITPQNRIKKFVAFSVANGDYDDPDSAHDFAVDYLLQQKDIAGNWGTMEQTVDIRDVQEQ